MQAESTQAPSLPFYHEKQLFSIDENDEMINAITSNGIVSISWLLDDKDLIEKKFTIDVPKKNRERLVLLAREYAQKGLSPEEDGRLEILEHETDRELRKVYEKTMESLNEFEGFVMNEQAFLDALDDQADI